MEEVFQVSDTEETKPRHQRPIIRLIADKMTQSSQALYISAYGQTDLGLVRKNNEDSFLIVDLTEGGREPAHRLSILPRARGAAC